MKKGWTITQLIASGALGVLMTIISIPASLFSVSIGIPGAGAILNAFILPFFVILSLLITDRFGAATIVGGIYGMLLLPTPITGPPGLLPKVLLWLLAGFIGDILWSLFRHKTKLAVVGTAGFMSLIVLFFFIEFLLLLHIPGGEIFAKLIKNPLVLIGIFLWGTGGGLSGWAIYQKIKNSALVKRIQQ